MTQLTEETSTTVPAETPRKHCWECLRRRLVCDSVRPVCNRCRTSGIVCPGYGEQQPLRWVKPGRVTARNRRRPKAEAGGAQGGQDGRVKKKTSHRAGRDVVVDADGGASKVDQVSSASEKSTDDGELREKFGELSLFSAMQPTALDSMMRYDIACENFAGLQASYNYNVEMYEACSPLTLLLPDSRFKLPQASITPLLPAPIKGLFILFAIGYQMHNLPRDIGENVRAHARSAVAFWTYQVVRALNEDIAVESTRASDGTMTGVLMLMLADQQLQPSTRWRSHYDGLMMMTRLRGGVEKLWHNSPHMHNGILTWIVGEVFANTTSPSHDQLTEITHPKNFKFLEMAWGESVTPVYIGSICPPALFVDVIRINHLRALATRGIAASPSSSTSFSSSSSSSSEDDDAPVYTDAQTLLNRILAFSPHDYADAHGAAVSRDKWLLMGRIHQSAVVLYCILALQHVLLLPDTPGLARTVSVHYDRLLLDLKDGFQYRNFKSCCFWPLVVAGAAAVRGTAFERAFIADLLSNSVGNMGSSMPIFARKVLMVFWGSGKKGWDECFDQPYLFVM